MEKNNGQFKRGDIPWNKGKERSEETKRKISIKNKGKHNSKKTEFKKGNIPWSFGVGHTKKSIEKMRRIKLGKKLSKEHREKIRLSLIGREVSDETRRKIGMKHKGMKPSKESILKYKEKRKNWVTPKKDTSIEIKIQNFLKQLGIEFFTHQYIHIEHGYQCDILIPSINLVIECDGDYWHKYPIGREIDHIRTKELLDKGFKVLRLWEHKIKVMKLNDLKTIIGGGKN